MVDKALALRKVMHICWEIELHQLMFEGDDCVLVVCAATALEEDLSEAATIIDDIHFML